jgi:hypothetical protein
VTGFLAPEQAGRLLAAADAAVFPFLDGGGEWNSSIHGAAAQGTFVLATSMNKRGYDAAKNIYYAAPEIQGICAEPCGTPWTPEAAGGGLP